MQHLTWPIIAGQYDKFLAVVSTVNQGMRRMKFLDQLIQRFRKPLNTSADWKENMIEKIQGRLDWETVLALTSISQSRTTERGVPFG